jgi:hypothetical protein
MKKHILIFSASIFLQLSVNAQSLERQVLATAGKYSSSAQLSLSYTVGETNTAGLFSPAFILTQGFQQPVSQTTSATQDLPKNTFSIFPNPAGSVFDLSHQLSSNTPFLIEFFNAAGQLVYSRKCENQPNGSQTFRCADWAAGTYTARLVQSGKNLFTSKFQIIR